MLRSKVARRQFCEKAFKITGIHHIAVGSVDKEGLKEFWIDILGGEVLWTKYDEKENTDMTMVGFGNS